jgi:hypothetical protein
MLNRIVLIAVPALAAGLLTGCSTSAPPQSQAALNSFKGGPMPADFAKKQAEIMAETAAQRDAAMAKHPTNPK